jgi:hypothetical protein
MTEFESGNSPQQEDLGIGLKIVSICVPIVGAILYFVWKQDHPKKSKQACNFALIGLGVNIVLSIIYTVFMGAMFAGSGQY